ncbi:MAG: hypothetical protein ACREQ4_07070 [Candidatus Binataceae bacterium]
MLKSVTLKEIERIFAITDALGISREALLIPLRTETPARAKRLKDGKIEIVVEREGDFDEWLKGLEPELRRMLGLD